MKHELGQSFTSWYIYQLGFEDNIDHFVILIMTDPSFPFLSLDYSFHWLRYYSYLLQLLSRVTLRPIGCAP